MPKAPSYQWYPGDLKRDTAVQACDFTARALWREMIDLMHDGEPYGHLTAGGIPIGADQLARIVGLAPARTRAALRELEDRKVFSRTDEGVIFSRRMVRDESLRQRRAAGGIKGGNPKLLAKNGAKDSHKVNGKVGAKVNLDANLQPTPAVAVAVAVKDELQKHPVAAAPASWSAKACEAWQQQFGGSAPGGRIGKALKPLIAKHGEPEVLDLWAWYLSSRDPQFASPQEFASKYSHWQQSREKPTASASSLDEYDAWMAKTQAEMESID